MKSTLIIFLTFLCSSAFAVQMVQTTRFPIADSYLDSGNINAKNGNSTDGWTLQDVYGSGAYFDLLVKVNISDLPANATAASIWYEQQYISSDETNGPAVYFDVFETETTWNEYNVSWSHPPSTLRTLATNVDDQNNQYMVIPAFTAYHDAKTYGRQLISLRTTSSYAAVPVYMKEWAIEHRPFILVTYPCDGC